eukprot:gene15002-16551_t
MASSSEDSMSALKFAKLNGGNYRTWAFNMRLYLESLDLFEHVDGSAEPPEGANATRSFRLRSKKAWTYICLAVEPEQQIHVRNTTTAGEAWIALKNQFARESILQKELAMTLLASLPEEFKPLITALDAVGEDNLSFEKVKEVEEGVVTKTRNKRNDHGTSGMTTERPRNKRNDHGTSGMTAEQAEPARNKRGITPQLCPPMAFLVLATTGRGRSSGQGGNSESKPVKVFRGTCHSCHEKGHFARDCPKRNAGNRNSQDSSGSNSRNHTSVNYATYKENDEVLNEEALYACSTKAIGNWIIDSGATQHMTCERDSLSDYVEFKRPSLVTLGDNSSISVYGKGTYRLVTDVEGDTQNIVLKNVLYLPDLEEQYYNFEKDESTHFFDSVIPQESSDDNRNEESRNNLNQTRTDDKAPVEATYEETFMNQVENLGKNAEVLVGDDKEDKIKDSKIQSVCIAEECERMK